MRLLAGTRVQSPVVVGGDGGRLEESHRRKVFGGVFTHLGRQSAGQGCWPPPRSTSHYPTTPRRSRRSSREAAAPCRGASSPGPGRLAAPACASFSLGPCLQGHAGPRKATHGGVLCVWGKRNGQQNKKQVARLTFSSSFLALERNRGGPSALVTHLAIEGRTERVFQRVIGEGCEEDAALCLPTRSRPGRAGRGNSPRCASGRWLARSAPGWRRRWRRSGHRCCQGRRGDAARQAPGLLIG